MYGPSGGYVGHYPERFAEFVKRTNDAECELLRGRGGHWFTPVEEDAIFGRARQTTRRMLEGL